MLYSEKMPIFTSKHPAQTVTVDGAAYARDILRRSSRTSSRRRMYTYHRPAGGPDEPAPPVTEADFRALKGRILLILPNQDFFSGQMQQDLIKLMQDPQIVYVSGGHLGTVLKAGDYVREIEKFLEGME